MGDTVQYHLERMVPELEDLEKRGLFSRSEIKEIVRRRRDFEYLLKRPSPLKQDFLRYVEYEKQLEALRKLKKKALIKGMSKSGEKWRNSLCDRSCAMRIMLIYERAVTRFKGDLNLWLQYVEFCKSHGSKRMQKVLTKALKLHSTIPGLWIYAAAWEFEHNLNVTAARALMQRGLRMCPTSENMWLEYFRMELTYVQKLRSRKTLLGLNGGGGNPAENSMTTGLDNQEPERVNSGTAHKVSSDAFESENKLSQNIASAVYRNAVAAIPSSARFRQNFLELLDSADFEHTHVLEETICESLAKDFPADEDCWDWQARHLFGKLVKQVQDNTVTIQEGLRQTCQVYENALQTVASSSMYELYSKFLEELLSLDTVNCKYVKLLEGDNKDFNAEMAAEKLVQLYEQAEKAGLASALLAEKHIGHLLRWGRLENATDLATSLCTSSMQTCGRVWALRLTLKTKPIVDSEKEKSALLELFQEALLHVPIIQAKPIWKLAMEYFAGNNFAIEKLLHVFKSSLTCATGGELIAELTCAIIDWILLCQGMDKARRLYTEILALPGPSVRLFRHCILIEARSVAMGDFEAFQHMRRLFNAAVEIYGKKDIELWCEYWSAEMKAGNVDAASGVYWRARKMLQDPSTFIQRVHSV